MAVALATVDLVQTRLRVLGIEVDQSEGAPRLRGNRAQHLFILQAECLRGRVIALLHAHGNTESPNPEPVRILQQMGKPGCGCLAGHTAQVAMHVPDFHRGASVRQAPWIYNPGNISIINRRE